MSTIIIARMSFLRSIFFFVFFFVFLFDVGLCKSLPRLSPSLLIHSLSITTNMFSDGNIAYHFYHLPPHSNKPFLTDIKQSRVILIAIKKSIFRLFNTPFSSTTTKMLREISFPFLLLQKKWKGYPKICKEKESQLIKESPNNGDAKHEKIFSSNIFSK